MAISHMVTGRCCHHPAISIYLALSQTCSPDRLELHLSGLWGGGGLGLDLGLGPGPRRPVTLWLTGNGTVLFRFPPQEHQCAQES